MQKHGFPASAAAAFVITSDQGAFPSLAQFGVHLDFWSDASYVLVTSNFLYEQRLSLELQRLLGLLIPVNKPAFNHA